jgi:RNA polymerase sigma-70 factor (ECF subfamily)
VRSFSDAELIDRCIVGDPLAQRALFDRFVADVYRTTLRLSGDADAASDYAQETFIKAFARLRQFRGDSSLAAWLRAIAASTAFSGERKRKRFRGDADPDQVVDGKASRGPNFDLLDLISSTLDRMSDKLRSVYLLHDVEGFTHEEIGEALGIPEGTSKARLSDARAKLRAALADYASERAS